MDRRVMNLTQPRGRAEVGLVVDIFLESLSGFV
jgi:hypothetical protein